MIADALNALAGVFSRGHVIGEDATEAEILLGGQPTAAGQRVSPERALTVAGFYAGVNIISSCVRAMPCRVVLDKGDGSAFRPFYKSRLWGLLHDQANPEQHASELWEWLTLCVIMRGNGTAWIDRDPMGRVQWLRPLNPGRVQIGRDLRTRRKIFVVHAADDREQVEFVGTSDDILHVKGFGTDPLVGVSVIHHMRETLGRALAEDRRAATMMKNNGRPSGILSVPGRLEDDAATRLSDRWRNAHGGGKAGGTAVLEQGADWKAVEMTAADMELVKQRAISREDMAISLQIPGDMLLAGSQANLHYSTDATRDVRLVKYGVMPWTRRIQDALEICALLPWGMTDSNPGRLLPRFYPKALLAADMKARYDAYKVGIDAGWLDPATVREWEDLDPIEGLNTTRPLTSPPTAGATAATESRAVDGNHNGHAPDFDLTGSR